MKANTVKGESSLSLHVWIIPYDEEKIKTLHIKFEWKSVHSLVICSTRHYF